VAVSSRQKKRSGARRPRRPGAVVPQARSHPYPRRSAFCGTDREILPSSSYGRAAPEFPTIWCSGTRPSAKWSRLARPAQACRWETSSCLRCDAPVPTPAAWPVRDAHQDFCFFLTGDFHRARHQDAARLSDRRIRRRKKKHLSRCAPRPCAMSPSSSKPLTIAEIKSARSDLAGAEEADRLEPRICFRPGAGRWARRRWSSAPDRSAFSARWPCW